MIKELTGTVEKKTDVASEKETPFVKTKSKQKPKPKTASVKKSTK
jgi:hypothetical protein